MSTEADTCRKYILPKLYAAGWTDDQINEQHYFTDGRIVVVGDKHYRKPGKKADYLLRYRLHLAGQVAALERLQSETATALAVLLPSILDKAFKWEL
jgi:hypothetical protein